MLWANISLALSKDPAHSTPHSHPSCGNRRQRECQAPLCARNPSEALSGALSGGRLGKWFVPPGNHCVIVLPCFLMTLILCGVHIRVTLSVLGTNQRSNKYLEKPKGWIVRIHFGEALWVLG